MQNYHTYSILFWLNKSRSKNNEAAIFLRITVNGKRAEISTKRYISPDQWNAEAGKAKGNSEKARTLNSFLDMTKGKIQEHYNQMIASNKRITAEEIKNRFVGISEKQKTFREVFHFHNEQMKAKIGIEFAKGTYQRYEIALRKLESFMKFQYKKSDIELEELGHKFIADFDFYLKTVDKIDQNTAVKYIKSLKKIARLAVLNGFLAKNPFENFKCQLKETERGFLSADDLEKLLKKDFSIKRLEEVRDVFIFSCYTGYAYADIVKLTPEHISRGIDGQIWIITNREKTKSISNVPLLPIAQELIEKYKRHPECLNRNSLFPVKSNQKMNAYLKEIGELCGIKKTLTCHLARHTFATTVTLSNGVPIETVSALLGHNSLKTTKIYAKVLDSKVANDMQALKEKLFKNQSKTKEIPMKKAI